MSTELLKLLSQDYSTLLSNGSELADVEVHVGQELKVYNVHSLVLWTRSPYFRSEIWSNKEEHSVDRKIIFSLPNINTKTFNMLLKYIYVGELDIASHGPKVLVQLMLAANDLGITNLIDCITKHLAVQKHRLSGLYFFINRECQGKLPELRELCDDIILNNPLSIIKSPEFIKVESKDELLFFYENLPEKLPASLPEVLLWEKSIEWGINHLKLPKDNNNYDNDQWEKLKQLLEPFIEHINFENINRNDFLAKVKPYKLVLNQDKYIELMEKHMDIQNQQPLEPPKPQPHEPYKQQPQQLPDQQSRPRTSRLRSKQQHYSPSTKKNKPGPKKQHNYPRPTESQKTIPTFPASQQRILSALESRPNQDDDIFCEYATSQHQEITHPTIARTPSSILSIFNVPTLEGGPSVIAKPIHFRLIKAWINKMHKRPYETQYDFNILVRGSACGFSANDFHRRCDNKGATVTLLKTHETNEILGGYNPLYWDTPSNKDMFLETNESFIFSLDFEKINDSVFTKVKEIHKGKAICLSRDLGPSFGSSVHIIGDLWVGGNNFSNCNSRLLMYEKSIRSAKSKFRVAEYEVFQVVEVFE
ncbi:9387_t:CDS:2 [Acaulospora morrowiae]|uniref:9387_t:CDS:1 n=1 Tax=Acaulospora morrowiae TaxID=94023 RepID=A0A9N9DBI2_9GLOM|nr:9387_t:CDS:2 [Acaulospora morrowiae]